MSLKTSLIWRWTGLILLMSVAGCNLRPTKVYWGTPLPAPTALPTGAGETWHSPPPTPPSTLPELIEALSSHSADVRIGAAGALGAMGPDAEAAVPALTKNLYYDGVYDVRKAAARALGEIGPAAKPAVPMLIVVLLTDSTHARDAAVVALGKIGDLVAVPALARGLYDESISVRISSAEAISQLIGRSFPGARRGLGGYDLDESGEAIIVIAAREWWKREGWQQSWFHDAVTPVSESTPVPNTPSP